MKGPRFLILADLRSGSCLLAETLNEHPDLTVCNYEPLQWKWMSDQLHEKEERDAILLEACGDVPIDQWGGDNLCDIDVSRFLENMWSRWNGFKIMRDYQLSPNSPTWNYLRKHKDIKIISLIRRNKLNQFISHELACKTGLWHVKSKQIESLRSTIGDTKIEINTRRLTRWMDSWKRNERWTAACFRHSGCLNITYEELDEQFKETMKRVMKFLGVRRKWIRPPIKKTNWIPLRNRVTNYDEVVNVMQQYKDQRYAEEPDDKLDKCVFTLMSNGFLAESLAALQSMQQFDPEPDYWLIVTDETLPKVDLRQKILEESGLHITSIKDVIDKSLLSELAADSHDKDCLRWRLKPFCFRQFLARGYKRLIYIDNDCHFYRNFDFLFDELFEHGILLTPHWYSVTPLASDADARRFTSLMENGIFNAGFVGISAKGLEPLNYWLEACEWRCTKDSETGTFVDQKYLNVIPIMYPEVCKIVRHRGCNVALWNVNTNLRVKQKNGKVLVNDEWPIVFAHFSGFPNQWGLHKDLIDHDTIRGEKVKEWHERIANWNAE